MNIDVNPNTALVTWPLAVAMSVGRAKKARYVSELPSSRSSLSAAPSAAEACDGTGLVADAHSMATAAASRR